MNKNDCCNIHCQLIYNTLVSKTHWYHIQSWITLMINCINQSLRNQSLLALRIYLDQFDAYSRYCLLNALLDQCPYIQFKGNS